MSSLAGSSRALRVHLVCYDDFTWILGKFAIKLRDELLAKNIQCDISGTSDPTADINHHINYYPYDGRRTTADTIMITHIDADNKLRRVQWQLVEAEMGVCMSAETLESLASRGIPRAKLCFVNPAHDGTMHPRKTVIGITTRVYPDGCKREGMLLELAESIFPEDFAFRIMGAGWNSIVSTLRDRGFEIEYVEQFDRDRYDAFMSTLDYYLYLGLDEGSMGFLDALAAGVGTIVTAQGFHLDVPGGITHAFIDGPELKRIFNDIAAERKARQRAVADWTWAEYARKHISMWEYVLARKAGRPVPEPLHLTLRKIGIDIGHQASSPDATGSTTFVDGLSAIKSGTRFRTQRSAAVSSHVPFRVGAAEHVQFMNYLVGAGATRAAISVALRAIVANPLDFNVWRRVISLALQYAYHLYKKLRLDKRKRT